MKNKFQKCIIILGVLILIGGAVGYMIYQKASDYMLQKVVENVMEKELDEYIDNLVASYEEEETITANSKEEQVDSKKESNSQASSESEVAIKEDVPSQSVPDQVIKDIVEVAKEDKEVIKEAAKQDIQAQAQAIVNQIPNKDKNSMMGLVLGNLSSSDLSSLMSLVADGNISDSDIAKAKEVALKSFSEEQLEQVKYYYSKYVHLVLQ